MLPATLITHAYDVNTVISIQAGCQKNWLLSNNYFCTQPLPTVPVRGSGDWLAGTNYRGLAVWGPTMLHIFLSFSAVSLIIDCTN